MAMQAETMQIGTLKGTFLKPYKIFLKGSWVAQSVEHLTYDFGSGHDLRVVGWNPVSSFTLSREPAEDSLMIPLPFSPTLSLSKTKQKKFLGVPGWFSQLSVQFQLRS